jgi:Carbohydrate esterase, sialic acid-specific acetylesterase
MRRRALITAIGLTGLLATLAATAGALEPAAAGERVARVFVLAGQSNMEGQAVVDFEGPDYNDGKGTIVDLLRHPDNAARLAWLRGADGTWLTLDNVHVRYVRDQQPILVGPLGIGYSVFGGTHHFGPELAFGKIVGDYFAERDEPVLLVKTAWGGKSLFTDFRPPSAKAATDADGRKVPKPGPFYKRMIADVKEALAAVPEIVPGATRGELAGFVWWHGWNDGVDPKRAVPAYENNLAALLRDVRRDLDAPDLPVVIGELTGPWVDAPASWEVLRGAQRRVAERKTFRDHARFVPTRDFVRAPADSPNPGHGHHEFGNAETYLLVGEALGRGMVSLLSGDEPAPTRPYARRDAAAERAPPGQPTGRLTNRGR